MIKKEDYLFFLKTMLATLLSLFKTLLFTHSLFEVNFLPPEKFLLKTKV